MTIANRTINEISAKFKYSATQKSRAGKLYCIGKNKK